MSTILIRKIPVLVELPEISTTWSLRLKFVQIKDRIKDSQRFKLPSYDILLQKILSKTRILILKAEKKISFWLQSLREKSTKKKDDDKYWQQVKTSIQEKEEES